MNLKLKNRSECKYDAVSLGEVMLRLDPGEGRIRTARNFQVWEGGGECNPRSSEMLWVKHRSHYSVCRQ